MRNLVFFLLCLVGLSACIDDMPPVRSGAIIYDGVHAAPRNAMETGPAAASRALSDDQLHALDQWLHSHRANWVMLAYAPPRPSISIALIHTDGTRSNLDIILKSYTGAPSQLLVLTRRDSNGKFLDAASRQLSNEEVSDVEGLLAATTTAFRPSAHADL
jgi:hypothetical protein